MSGCSKLFKVNKKSHYAHNFDSVASSGRAKGGILKRNGETIKDEMEIPLWNCFDSVINSFDRYVTICNRTFTCCM